MSILVPLLTVTVVFLVFHNLNFLPSYNNSLIIYFYVSLPSNFSLQCIYIYIYLVAPRSFSICSPINVLPPFQYIERQVCIFCQIKLTLPDITTGTEQLLSVFSRESFTEHKMLHILDTASTLPCITHRPKPSRQDI